MHSKSGWLSLVEHRTHNPGVAGSKPAPDIHRLKIKGSCSGCKLCAIACAFVHEKSFNPRHARLFVKKEEPATDRIIVCMHCKKPVCKAACKNNALVYYKNVLIVDATKCDGCGRCVVACKNCAVQLHPITKKALKCDLCIHLNYRACVQFCPMQIIKCV